MKEEVRFGSAFEHVGRRNAPKNLHLEWLECGGCGKGDWTVRQGGVASWNGPSVIFEGFVLHVMFIMELQPTLELEII